MKRLFGWWLAAMALQHGAAFADAEPVATAYPLAPQAAAQGQGSGDAKATQTERWLRAQSSGRYASPHLQRATLAEQELANQRLLDSYSHPIPEFFDDEVGGKLDE